MGRRFLPTILTLTLLCSLVSCDSGTKSPASSPLPTVDNRPVAPAIQKSAAGAAVIQIGKTAIDENTLKAEMALKGGRNPQSFTTLASKQALAQELIHQELLFQEAKKAGLDEEPDFTRQVKALLIHRFKEYRIKSALDQIHVPTEEVKRYYEDHPDEFFTPARVKTAMIFKHLRTTQTKAQQEALRQEFATWRAQLLKAPQEFAQLAKRYSEETRTKARGGAMEWIYQGGKNSRWESTILKEALQLSTTNALSPVIETSRGLYLLQLLQQEPGQQQPFNAATAENIENRLLQEKRRNWLVHYYRELESKAEIVINQPRLEALTVDRLVQRNQPPAAPFTGTGNLN